MSHSKSVALPKKPRPDFPLTPRGDGGWCKRVHGKLHYFTGTADEALDEWLRVKDDLLAGREARPKEGCLELAELVNAFLHHKKQMLDSGELAERTWGGYESVGKMPVTFFGRTFPAEQLRTTDFQKLRAHLAKQYGPVALGNRIQVVRMIFRFGYRSKLLAKEAEFGVAFREAVSQDSEAGALSKRTAAIHCGANPGAPKSCRAPHGSHDIARDQRRTGKHRPSPAHCQYFRL